MKVKTDDILSYKYNIIDDIEQTNPTILEICYIQI